MDQKTEVASRWRIRFALPDDYYTFVEIGAKGSTMTKAEAMAWAKREVRDSNGRYSAVSSVYSIDGETHD